MELGKQIKMHRQEAHLSQEELANRVYVSRQTISNWENDKSYPDVNSLVLLSEAVSFISKYYKDRGLIPLCAIATMYNDLFYYNREMYREFCCCTKEVQNRILEYCGLDLRVSEYSIYEKCLVAIESVLNKRFPDDKSVFYDGGKYFTRSLEYYAAKPIPHQEFEYQNHITDVLANAFNSNDKKETPIQQLSVEYSFGSCKEIEACQLVTVIAEFAAI